MITKPIIAVLILIDKYPSKGVKSDINYLSKSDLDDLWFKCRDLLKSKDFITKLESFDIRRVTQGMLNHINHLFKDDQWMTNQWIARESLFSLNMFKWVNTIMDYIGVAMKLKDLGMQEIEKKRDQCLFNKQQA